ncbi:hypothetical protein EVAR_27406_1 [Eumeta japonica]|uniref:Integrase catalytic domain-containing protein n=1 Tax=Eumeta variegata TaxID=151549 RepID=A0A4C1X599_EUMVA|nr:hypothetical protein EVAR_27406_1 [Eumeta japonica]
MVPIGCRREKRYGTIFTCLTTRAVHVELTASLSASSFILALRQIFSRRGRPARIWSDNGTNFRDADSELRAAYKGWLPTLQKYEATKGVDLRFILPRAPHMGGAWERLFTNKYIGRSSRSRNINAQPFLNWRLIRITRDQTMRRNIESNDGCIRIADIATNGGTFRHPVSRLAVLCTENENKMTPKHHERDNEADSRHHHM